MSAEILIPETEAPIALTADDLQGPPEDELMRTLREDEFMRTLREEEEEGSSSGEPPGETERLLSDDEESAPPPPEMALPPPPPRLTKKVLVERIKAYQERLVALGVPATGDVAASNLMRNKVSDLKALHGRLRERVEQPKRQQKREAGLAAPDGRLMEKLLDGAMFMTVMSGQVVEKLVNETGEYHGIEMEGYPETLKAHEAPLKQAFQQIIEEEGEEGPLGAALSYLSGPYAQLGLVFAAAAVSCAKKKADPPSRTSSPSSESL